MSKLKLIAARTHFEVESNYNNARNITQFQIFLDGEKQFIIEPTMLYGHGNKIIWGLAEESKNLYIDYATIAKLGSAIENLIN